MTYLISETTRQYLQQIRQETGVRILEKVFVDDKPSKVSAQ